MLRPNDDIPRPLLELLRLLEGGLNLAEENLIFPRLAVKEGMELVVAPLRGKKGFPYCPEDYSKRGIEGVKLITHGQLGMCLLNEVLLWQCG